LDCIGIHNGVPLLWHDQTKVGNYNEAIRIPDYTYQRLRDRQRTTITRFEQRYARTPNARERASMVLFPRACRNPNGAYPIAYSWFHGPLRRRVDSLAPEPAAPHHPPHPPAPTLPAPAPTPP